MAGGLTEYAVTAILAGTPLPTTLYLKFHINDPGPNATAAPATETTRKAFTLEPGTAPFTAQNDALMNWTGLPATEVATFFSAWDAASGGNPWVVGPLTSPAELVSGGDVTINPNRVTFSLTPYGA